jgi:SEC-C motif-containing protein
VKKTRVSGACPCHSRREYLSCCALYLGGAEEARTPVALMRSRYAAFALGKAEYLWRTLHADHPDRARDRDEVLRSLRGAKDRLRYMSLSILDSRSKDDLGEGQVLFAAGVFERGQDRSFVELSDFRHDGEGWRYLSGVTVPLRELGRSPEGLTIAAFLPVR